MKELQHETEAGTQKVHKNAIKSSSIYFINSKRLGVLIISTAHYIMVRKDQQTLKGHYINSIDREIDRLPER